MLERTNELAAGILGFGVIFTPEVLELLTAVVVMLNTVLIVRHTRRATPKLDHISELAEGAVTTAEEVAQNLIEKERTDRRQLKRGGRRGTDQ